MDGMDSIAIVQAAAFVGAAFVMAIGSIGPALGQGMIGKQACESVGKYPEGSGKIQMTMMIALGAVESSAVYCFIIGIMLMLVSPGTSSKAEKATDSSERVEVVADDHTEAKV